MRWADYARRSALALLTATALVSCASEPPKRPASSGKPAVTTTNSNAEVEGQANASRVPAVIQGNGQFYQQKGASGVAVTDGSGGGFELRFVDTDIAAVVGAVLGEGLGVPYMIDPQVKGTITLQSSRALSADQVVPALEASLAVQGFGIVERQGVYHIVPLKDASRAGGALRVPGSPTTSGFVTEVVPLTFVSAVEMQKILQPFAKEGGVLRVDEVRNLLILSGTSQEVVRLQQIVGTFDVDWLAGMSFGIFPLEYVDAKTLSSELEDILIREQSPLAGVLRFVPLPRINSLLVVTHQPRYLQDVQAWIKRLDLGATTPGRRIYVYDVQNAKADELARSLSRILSLEYQDTSSGAGASTGLSQGSQSQAGLMGQVERPMAPRMESSGSQGEVTRIVPNAENNSLMILATPSEFSVIEAALKRLDVMPIQVLIEASLAEVTLTDDMRYGLQWAYTSGDGTGILSESSTGSISPQFPGFSYLFTGRTDIRAVLNAIESFTNVKVLSSPKLMVLNNREARLQIGDQVPIVTQSTVGTNNPDAPMVNMVEYSDTGVILRVVPRVNKSGLVMLEIEQEVSDVVPTTSSGIDSPTIQQRRIQSTVAVTSGETIALGGLIRETGSRSRSGLPLVSRLPFVGSLFGSTDRVKRRTELIILLTPKVLHTQDDLTDTMEALRSEFKGLRRVVPGWKNPIAGPANVDQSPVTAPSVPEASADETHPAS